MAEVTLQKKGKEDRILDSEKDAEQIAKMVNEYGWYAEPLDEEKPEWERLQPKEAGSA